MTLFELDMNKKKKYREAAERKNSEFERKFKSGTELLAAASKVLKQEVDIGALDGKAIDDAQKHLEKCVTILQKAKEDNAVKQRVQAEHSCVICMTESKSVLFRPCLHLCICSKCNLKVFEKCPICRSVIEEKIQGIFP
mmetsp:Transcript_35258/g.44934  ORF Transcript_35258/g.44934 Transcript_35258/m.44934 type:complete len:139 (-) Transcript_35258:321-737(-)